MYVFDVCLRVGISCSVSEWSFLRSWRYISPAEQSSSGTFDAWTRILYHVWRMSTLYRPEISCKQWSPCSALSFLSSSLTYYPLISLLLLSATPACLCSPGSFVLPFYLDLTGLKMCTSAPSPASRNSSPFVSFFCLLPAIRPRQRAGTIQRWQNCTKLWVSKETIKAPSESCSFAQEPHWAAAAPAARHHRASALKALSHSSLRALYFKHLRDYIATVINLRGPICQRCDCFLLSL